MITTQETVTGLFAAWRMFMRDRRAIALFDDSLMGVIKSFFCAVLVLPGYILIMALGPGDGSAEVGFFRLVTVNAAAYVVLWVAWPLLMAYIAPALDRDAEYFRYVVAYNWSWAPQILLILIVILLAASGVVPRDILVTLNIAAIVVMVLYHLFILRVALRLTLLLGIALVVAELILSQFVILVRDGMLG